MRAVLTLLAAWLGLAVSLPSPADPRPELVFFTWADYVDPAVIADFEHESGARVRQVFFESDDACEISYADKKGKYNKSQGIHHARVGPWETDSKISSACRCLRTSTSWQPCAASWRPLASSGGSAIDQPIPLPVEPH